MRRTDRAACLLAALSLLATIELDSRAPIRSPQSAMSTGGMHARRTIDFIENRGQWDPSVRFVAQQGSAMAIVGEATLTFRQQAERPETVSLTFEGASPDAIVTGEGKRETRYNFYIGKDSATWRSDVPAYAAVVNRGVYEGVDVRLHERAGRLEYALDLMSGADLERLVIRADGISSLHIADDGRLVLDTPNGSLEQSAPVAWEELPNGGTRPVESRFRWIDSHRYGFQVDQHDPALPLVIDPGLVWSTFLGGSGADFIGPAAVARDGTGDVFVGGTMASADFPLFSDPSFAPGTQVPAFVARLDATGSILRYATFIGGWHAQIVHRGLAVDAAGNAVLVGQTFSPDFPTTPAAFDQVGINKDAFVVRLDPTGRLIFSTFLGGSGEDDAYAVGYDPAGNVIVGGVTVSRDFPTTPTAFDPAYNVPNAPADGGAEGDMFVVRLTPDGSALTYGTFLGGPQADVLEDLVVDSSGFVTVCGWVTGNNVQVFVTTPDAFDRTWNGSQDAAIARLKLDGAGAADLKYATLIGGASQDNLWVAAIDPTNPELVTFAGRSWSNNYPTTLGVVRPTNPPFSQLFPDVEAGIITRFRFPTAGSPSLVWSTYHNADRITGLTVNAAGEPIVAGPSAPWDLVTTPGAFDRTADGSGAPGAGFLSRLSADATQYVYQSFFGGSGGIADNFQTVPQVAYLAGNTVIVSGQTTSNNFPITAAAVDPTSSNAIGGDASNEGFVTSISLDADTSGDVSAAAPTLVSPADGATFHNGLLGRLEWSAVTDPAGIDDYEFQVSVRSDFAKDFMLFRGAVAATEVIIPPSVGNSGGLPQSTFFWRVRTADRAGNLSAWSPARTFTVSFTTGQPTISAVDVDSPIVTGGAQATGMLHLYDAAPPGGLVARLTAVHDRSQGLDRTRTLPVPVSVPELVNIPAGALSASFPITTTAVSDVMAVNLIATVNGVGGSGTMSVGPSEAPSPVDVTVLPGIVTGGNPATGVVTLSQPAASGGTSVSLSSTHPAAASVPASVTVAAGSRTATFGIATHSVGTEIDVTIVAKSGSGSWNRPFYVRPLNRLPQLTSMTISPTTVSGGTDSGGTLTFSGPIPLGTWPALPDAVVRFSSSDPEVAAVYPGDDYVLAGSTSHAFRIFTRGIPTTRNVTLSAHFDAVTLSGVFTVGAVTGVTISSLGSNVTTLRGGEGGIATVRLAAPAPVPLLVTISTNHPELFSSLPSSVTVFTGSTTGSFAFVTSKSVSASTAVTLSIAYGTSAASLTLTVNPPASATPPLVAVTLAPTAVDGGTSSTGTVTLQSAAPAGGAVVQLFSSDAAATVPASVTVPAGASSATFPVTTTSVSTETAVVISGLLRLSASTTLTIRAGAGPPPTPSAPTLVSPPNGAKVAQPVTFDWTDVTAAASYQIQIDDSSTFTAPLVVDQILVPSQFTAGGFSSVRHWWRVRGINSAGTAGPWSVTRRFDPSPAPAAPSLSSITLNPTSVVGGGPVQGTATLTAPAPTGGAGVTLSSSNTAVATLPASVTVTAGGTSATFTITTSAVSTSTPVTITGAYGGATRTATLTVTPPPPPPPAASLSAVSVSPTSVVGGASAQGTVTLTAAAPTGGFGVTLSSDSSAATVPASVTVPASATSATFTISTTMVTASTVATVTGSAGGVTRTAALTVTPSPPPSQTATLTVTATGRGGETVTSSPAGIAVPVGSTGSASFATGTVITLSATNSRDVVWSGACSSGGQKAKTCTFTLSAAATVTANVQ